MPGLPWTEKEIETLKKLYSSDVGFETIYKQLPNRNPNSIWCKAKTMGLRRASERGHANFVLTPTQAAYLAGVVDSDGTISMRIARRNRKTKKYTILPYVGIYNTNQTVMKWTRSLLGLNGRINLRHRTPVGAQQRPIYEFAIHSVSWVHSLLKHLEPYLIIKQKQANLVIQFCQNRTLYTPYTEKELELAHEVQALNKANRGPLAFPT